MAKNEMPHSLNVQEIVDNEHLKLLSIFHFIAGGIVLVFSSLFIFHFVFASMLAINPQMLEPPGGPPPDFPQELGYAFMVMSGVFILAGWTMGATTIYSGLCMRGRKKRVLSLIISAIHFFFFPFGTILSVFTIIVLVRDSVKQLYKA